MAAWGETSDADDRFDLSYQPFAWTKYKEKRVPPTIPENFEACLVPTQGASVPQFEKRESREGGGSYF